MPVSTNHEISLDDDCSVSSSEIESLIKRCLFIESKEERTTAPGFLAGMAGSNEKPDIKHLASMLLRSK